MDFLIKAINFDDVNAFIEANKHDLETITLVFKFGAVEIATWLNEHGHLARLADLGIDEVLKSRGSLEICLYEEDLITLFTSNLNPLLYDEVIRSVLIDCRYSALWRVILPHIDTNAFTKSQHRYSNSCLFSYFTLRWSIGYKYLLPFVDNGVDMTSKGNPSYRRMSMSFEEEAIEDFENEEERNRLTILRVIMYAFDRHGVVVEVLQCELLRDLALFVAEFILVEGKIWRSKLAQLKSVDK